MDAAAFLDALRSPAALAVLEIAWVLGASVWMLLERRSPAATLAWILALAVIPILGVPVYLALGPRRLRRKKLRMALARRTIGPALEAWERATAAQLDRSGQLMRLATRLDAGPPERARSLSLYADGDDCYRAMLEAVAASRDHVHAEYYIVEPDGAGTRFRDALAAAARRGVSVRLLVDAAGSARLSRRFLAPLLAAGARFARFNPVFHQRLGQRIANFRTHRKILVVDGRVGFTGGVNVCDHHSRAASGEERLSVSLPLAAAALNFTRREQEVLQCLVEGLENKAIAERLVISPRTVGFHMDNIFAKLGVRSRTEAAVIAMSRGLVRRPSEPV